jgi:hypothetical protein
MALAKIKGVGRQRNLGQSGWNRRDHVKRKLLTNLQVNVVKKKLYNNTPINAIVNTVSNISYRQLLEAYVTG